jgi:hypothetical protein
MIWSFLLPPSRIVIIAKQNKDPKGAYYFWGDNVRCPTKGPAIYHVCFKSREVVLKSGYRIFFGNTKKSLTTIFNPETDILFMRGGDDILRELLGAFEDSVTVQNDGPRILADSPSSSIRRRALDCRRQKRVQFIEWENIIYGEIYLRISAIQLLPFVEQFFIVIHDDNDHLEWSRGFDTHVDWLFENQRSQLLNTS